MGTIASTCLRCGTVERFEEPEFDPLEPGDDGYEQAARFEAEVREHGRKHLCGDCAEKLEAGYADRAHEAPGTLAEVLARSSRLKDAMFAELLDPSTREALEVFPGLNKHLPAYGKAERNLRLLEGPLAHIGKPVAIWDPVEDSPDDEPFVVFELNEAGRMCVNTVGHYDLIEMGAVNALDYAPNGEPRAK